MSPVKLEGIVVHKSSRYLQVKTPEGVLRSSLRGRFRVEDPERSPVVVGDRVLVSPLGGGEAVLEEVLPRRSELRRARAAPGPSGGERRRGALRAGARPREVVVAANADKILAVLAACTPPPRWSLADRVLISAEAEGLEAGICLNKWDQVRGGAAAGALEGILELYRGIGYAAFAVSALERSGLEPLAEWLRGAMTVLSGHSGVGKSTLLNSLAPGAGVLTGALNPVTGRGRQTTTAVALYEVSAGGYLVDTPGYREYGLGAIEPAGIGRYFREFQPHLGACRFKDCLHTGEPDCGVRRAVERGEVSELRYRNYLQILESV